MFTYLSLSIYGLQYHLQGSFASEIPSERSKHVKVAPAEILDSDHWKTGVVMDSGSVSNDAGGTFVTICSNPLQLSMSLEKKSLLESQPQKER